MYVIFKVIFYEDFFFILVAMNLPGMDPIDIKSAWAQELAFLILTKIYDVVCHP